MYLSARLVIALSTLWTSRHLNAEKSITAFHLFYGVMLSLSLRYFTMCMESRCYLRSAA